MHCNLSVSLNLQLNYIKDLVPPQDNSFQSSSRSCNCPVICIVFPCEGKQSSRYFVVSSDHSDHRIMFSPLPPLPPPFCSPLTHSSHHNILQSGITAHPPSHLPPSLRIYRTCTFRPKFPKPIEAEESNCFCLHPRRLPSLNICILCLDLNCYSCRG